MLNQFKDFLLKTNVLDLAVAVIIGEAFARIISSVVDDIITPLLMTPFFSEDVNELTWGMVRYGNFAAAVIKFLIIGYLLFLVIKMINRVRDQEPTKVQEYR